MRILTMKEAKEMDINFIYARGDRIAIVNANDEVIRNDRQAG